MADGTPGIDPRFAAQFQRGYDGPVITRPNPASPHSTRDAPLRVSGGRATEVTRVPAPPAMRAAAGPDEEPADVEEPDESLGKARPRTEWALLVVAVLMFILAAVLFQGSVAQAVQYQGTGSDWSDQVYALAVGTLPGPLMLAGVVALCLWAALRAVDSGRGSR